MTTDRHAGWGKELDALHPVRCRHCGWPMREQPYPGWHQPVSPENWSYWIARNGAGRCAFREYEPDGSMFKQHELHTPATLNSTEELEAWLEKE